MRSTRKRTAAELDVNHGPANESSLLGRVRNMWQFANLCQWIYLFGKAVRIPDDVDIEVRNLASPSYDLGRIVLIT